MEGNFGSIINRRPDRPGSRRPFDQHAQVAEQVPSSNDEVPMPSLEDQALMDETLRAIQARTNESRPAHARPVESRNRQTSTPDTFSFNEDPVTEGAQADETVLHKLKHDDVLEYSDNDFVIQYFQEHESAFSSIIENINEKIASNQYSDQEVAKLVRDKIELFVAYDYLYKQSSVRDGGQPAVLWNRIAIIAQENGVVISNNDSAYPTAEQNIQIKTSDNEGGFFARLKKLGRYFYQP